jgi:hypothetical protein
MSLPEIKFDYTHFIDKTVILYGPSKTGKTQIIIDAMYMLEPYIEQAIIISPTDRQNHVYDRMLPLPVIHYTITDGLLESMWERQSAFAAVYSRANNPVIIKQLYDRVSTNISEAAITAAEKKLADYSAETKDSGAIAAMEAECKKFVAMVHKYIINRGAGDLAEMELSDEEEFALRYRNFNPKMLIVFDDCTDLLKKYSNHPVMKKMFYQGRHNHTTTLIACHTDKAIVPELKKSAFMNIYTERKCAHAYFTRGSNDFDKADVTTATRASDQAFTQAKRYQKLAWIREDDKFFRFTATPHDAFRFGCDAMWEYCDKVKADPSQMCMNNAYMSSFVRR